MRKISLITKLFAACIVVLSPSLTWAADAEMDTIVVTAPKYNPDTLGGNGGGPPGGNGGNGGREGNGDNIKIPLFVDLIKTDKRFCIRPGETCTPGWSTRMTAGSINPPERGVCQGFGGNASVCASAVGQESAVQDCANVSANNPC